VVVLGKKWSCLEKSGHFLEKSGIDVAFPVIGRTTIICIKVQIGSSKFSFAKVLIQRSGPQVSFFSILQ
jgi:hypothetical protein